MKNYNNKKIYIIDSDAVKITKILQKSDVICKRNNDPKIFIKEAKKVKPDIIVGDFYAKNQDILIEELRKDDMLTHVPVILCTDKNNIAKVIRKINGNVNDYLVTPFEREELLARIERVLTRHEKILNSNPLSHLPGSIMIKQKVDKLIKDKHNFSFIYLDLDNFKAYNDYYGYAKGDEVIKLVANLASCNTLTEKNPIFNNFVGHIGGDDFAIIRNEDNIEEYCKQFISKFDKKIKPFYSEGDYKRGYITTFDRKNNLKQFPIMTISMAVIVVNHHKPVHFGEISLIGSEIKKYLKSFNGSNYLIDRRVLKKKIA